MNSKEKTKLFKKRVYDFVLHLILFIKSLPEDKVTRVITNQLLRSGTSILANYIEGLSSSSRKDCANFFSHSLKAANESKVWLALLRDSHYGNKEEITLLLKELDEYAHIFAASILALKGKRK